MVDVECAQRFLDLNPSFRVHEQIEGRSRREKLAQWTSSNRECGRFE